MYLNNLFLIENGTFKRLETYIYNAQEETENELFKCKNYLFSNYGVLNVGIFPTIKKTQFNKYVREGKSFFIKAIYKNYDKEQKTLCDSWDNSLDLYLSKNDIKSIEELETFTEFTKGKKDIEKYYIIETLKPLFITKGTDLKIYKDFQDIPDNYKHTAEKLEEKKERLFTYWKTTKPEKAENLKKHYNDAIKKGFVYSAFVPSSEKKSCIFKASCGVVRYEKDAEYLKAEKLTKEINSFLYQDHYITTSQMLNILSNYKITKRRK